ncbi:hypothetical protein TorRG33x02_201450 [Trema orientale]|uniref:Uncharacterized protein n=1 Tax=Trema orientale TaxID=63057 RepID=A0A2P5EER0_TREOI|nr:hypothetical protein TorRG33x02_201450 [Trema orientale]
MYMQEKQGGNFYDFEVENCLGVIKSVWVKEDCEGDGRLFNKKLERATGALSKWRTKTFGYIPMKIRALSKEIEELNRYANLNSSLDRVRILEIERDKTL